MVDNGLVVYDFYRTAVKKKLKKEVIFDNNSNSDNNGSNDKDNDDKSSSGKPNIVYTPGGKKEDDKENRPAAIVSGFEGYELIPVSDVDLYLMYGTTLSQLYKNANNHLLKYSFLKSK